MNKAICLMGALILSANANAAAEPERMVDGVRFNAFATDAGNVLIVARGKPGQDAASMRAAFDARANELCQEARPTQQLTQGEYDVLDGGRQTMMPAGGAFLHMTQYHTLKKAPLLSGTVECKLRATALPPAPPIKIFIATDLGETITYLDQGFASFNREQLNVPVAGTALLDTLAQGVSAALAARGYQPSVVASAEQADVTLMVSKTPVPQERFKGMALLTKIGLIGITNLSAEFCSVAVSVRRSDGAGEPHGAQVSTRKLIKPIYGNWARDMASGPAPEVHAKVSADLAKTLYEDVAAAIHALPPAAFDKLASAVQAAR